MYFYKYLNFMRPFITDGKSAQRRKITQRRNQQDIPPEGHESPAEARPGRPMRPRRPNTHRTTAKDYTATLHEPRVSNDFPYTGLPGPPSLVFVLCLCLFVCLFVCLSVCLYDVVCTRDSLGHPPLNCFSAAPGHRLLPYLMYRLH